MGQDSDLRDGKAVVKTGSVHLCAVDLEFNLSDDAGREAAALVRGGALGGTRTPNLLIRSYRQVPALR